MDTDFETAAVTARVAFVTLVAVFVGSLAGALAGGVLESVSPAVAYGVQAAVASLTIGLVAVAAVVALRHGVSFFDLGRPTVRTVGVGALAGVAMLGLLWSFGVVTDALGVPSASHGVVARIRETPTVALVMVVVSVVAVAPGEELLARGYVQKALYDAYSAGGAVVVASAVFAAVHVFAYWTAPPAAVAAALVQLFVISLVLGWTYVYTDSLVAPVVGHAVYDAVQFLYAYVVYVA